MKREGATIGRTLVYAAMNARRAQAIEAAGVTVRDTLRHGPDGDVTPCG
jgi:hypothetical protein